MTRARRLLAALAVGAAAVTIAPEAVDAAPSACKKFNGGDWGYTFCAKGRGVYFTRIRCLHWVDDTPVVFFAYGNFAKAKIDASTAWCPDRFHVARIRWFRVPT